MKNRYDNLLQKHNQKILELCLYDSYLFNVAAHQIGKIYKKDYRLLEIGCGEGDSALPILERTSATIDLLDVSKKMLEIATKRLKTYANRTRYIHADALAYLASAEPYDIIYSAMTIHNFTQADRKKLLSTIYENLKPGGVFILLDKIYPGRDTGKLLDKQVQRYHRYLRPVVARAIVEHEKIDASAKYRLDERPLVSLLKKTGFKKIELVDRVEREAVLVAQK